MIRTVILAACDSVSLSVVPFLAVNRLALSLTADSFGGGGFTGFAPTTVSAIPTPQADGAMLLYASPG